jgi:hypothetical protein
VFLVNVVATDCTCVTSIKHGRGNGLTKSKTPCASAYVHEGNWFVSNGGRLVWWLAEKYANRVDVLMQTGLISTGVMC